METICLLEMMKIRTYTNIGERGNDKIENILI